MYLFIVALYFGFSLGITNGKENKNKGGSEHKNHKNISSGEFNNNLVWLEAMREEEINISHRTDSMSLLIHVSMLILAVLASWLFRLRRFPIFHETGITLMIGMAAGGLIRLWLSSIDNNNEPDMVTVHLTNANQLVFAPARLAINISGYEYAYNLEGVIATNHHGVIKDEDVEQLEEKSSFNPQIFFYVLLPPIVFHAGYELQKNYFFRNFGSIVTLAFAGTAVSCFATGFLTFAYCYYMKYPIELYDLTECMLFGAIISATDPVTVLAIFHDLHVEHDLSALVFGESVLNDALAIGLYRSVLTYMSYRPAALRKFNLVSLTQAFADFLYVIFGSFVIGIFFAALTAYITKKTKIGMFPLLETAFLLLMSYSTFLIAEVANWSGIIAILFCGIAQKSYTYYNLSHSSVLRIGQFFHLVNFLSESFIFTYIGLSVFLFGEHRWNWGFILFSVLSVQAARAINVYPLSAILNIFRKKENKIPFSHQHVMVWSGMRGAMAFALAIRNTASEARQLMLTATLFCVLFSVIIQGGLTLQVIKFLKIRTGVPPEPEYEEEDDDSTNYDTHLVQDHSEGSKTDQSLISSKSAQSLVILSSNQKEQENENELQADVSSPSQYGWMMNKFILLDKNYIRPFLTDVNKNFEEKNPKKQNRYF